MADAPQVVADSGSKTAISEDARAAGSPAPDGRSAGSSITRNALHLVAGQVLTTTLAILLSATLGRSLGADDFGLFFIVTSMAGFAYVIVDWGQSLYVIREVARDVRSASELLGTALVLRALGALIVSLLAAGTAHLLGYDFRTCALTALMVVAMLPFAQAQAIGLLFRGLEQMDKEALVSVINKALILGCTLLVVSLGARIPGAIAAQGIAGILALGVAALLLRRLGIGPLRCSIARGRELIAGGSPIFLLSFGVAAHSYLDAIILSRLSPAEVVGWYGAAKAIFGTLLAPATILATAAYPRFSRAAHDRDAFRHEIQVAVRPLLGLAALGASGTYLFADSAIDFVYGAGDFLPAGQTLRFFAPVFFLLFLDLLLGTAVVAAGRTKPLAIAKLINTAVATGLGILLIPWFQSHYGNGSLGIVVAFGASELIMFVAAALLLPRGAIRPSVLFADGGRAIITGALTIALIQSLPALPLILAVPACALVFGVFSVGTGLIERRKVRLALVALQGRMGRQPSGAG